MSQCLAQLVQPVCASRNSNAAASRQASSLAVPRLAAARSTAFAAGSSSKAAVRRSSSVVKVSTHLRVVHKPAREPEVVADLHRTCCAGRGGGRGGCH
jgi:hypothetical protein